MVAALPTLSSSLFADLLPEWTTNYFESHPAGFELQWLLVIALCLTSPSEGMIEQAQPYR